MIPSKETIISSNPNSSITAILCSPAALWLTIWMVNNIGVTLLNKAAFATVDFHYPWILSAIHMVCNYLGAMWVFYTSASATTTSSSSSTGSSSLSLSEMKPMSQQPLAVRLLGHVDRRQLNWNEYKIMVAFSILFTLNIAIGNLSLNYVTVNFNQVMRSLVPAVTIVIGILFLQKIYSINRKLSIVPIMVGVAMACFGDMSYSTFGFIITVFCVILAALKAVAAGELLTGNLKLHPVDLLARLAPLAFIQCIIVACINGELVSMIHNFNTDLNPITVSIYPLTVVFLSGFASFTLNISSFQANKVTSALTLCIAANVKQVLMIWLSTIIFHTNVSVLNASGIIVVLGGSAYYSYVCLQEKDIDKQQQQQSKQYQQIPTSDNNNSNNNDGDKVFSALNDDNNDHHINTSRNGDIEFGGSPSSSPKNSSIYYDANDNDNDDNNMDSVYDDDDDSSSKNNKKKDQLHVVSLI